MKIQTATKEYGRKMQNTTIEFKGNSENPNIDNGNQPLLVQRRKVKGFSKFKEKATIKGHDAQSQKKRRPV